MPRTPFRAVAFDMDGLLVNTEDIYDDVGSQLVQRRGHQLDAQLVARMMGQPGPAALQLMIDFYRLTETVEQLQLETDEIFSGLLPHRLATLPGVETLLVAVQTAGHPRALTTSSRMQFVQQVLDLCQLASHFDFHLTAEDVKQGKPNPEIYIKAAARFGVEPQELLVFEDSQNGCRAAVAAGATVVAVPSKHAHLQDYSGARLVVESLEDRRIYELLDID